MKIVSSFVREQHRYTKNQIRSLFSFDEMGVERFIKNLKSYGILKTVANNKDQLDMTDLLDEDVQITDETAGNDDCLYVFTFVGVITCGNRVIKVYPKYLISQSNPTVEMTQIIKVLQRYSHSDEQIVNLFNGDGDNRSFNTLAVILYLLNDYFECGIYNNTEDIIEVNGEGDILWQRTIDDGFAIIEGNRPFYTEMFTRKTIDDDQDYFKRLHECVLTECSQQLREAGLEELFEMETVDLSEETLSSFGDKEFVLDRILAELSIQFNTHRQMLLKTLYTYISQDRRMMEENQGLSMFGTTAFHRVWEVACAEVFNNKLDTPIGRLVKPLAAGYNPKDKLIDIIEHPKWQGSDMKKPKEPKDTLIPDTITISKCDGTDWFIIFDAKYYLLQLEDGKPLRGNPGIGDITKQYLYQLAYQRFIREHNIAAVKTCFLMPTEGNEIVEKGTARMDMLSNLGLEDIQIRLLPAERVFSCYLNRKLLSIEELHL